MNTCPTGIATQDERLRAKFRGTPEGAMAYYRALAHDVRTILAEMGFRGLAEIIGRTDLLTIEPDERYPGSRRMNLTTLFQPPAEGQPRMSWGKRNDNPSPSLNDRISYEIVPFIQRGEAVAREYDIRNTDRSVPVRLSYYIAKHHGTDGLPSGTIRLVFRGTAGQSFGAFNHKGITIELIGDANDYAGKGMHGGIIILRPEEGLTDPSHQVIVGNTVLYGATGGEFYAAGIAGERFGVRNSGAVAVVEGTGQHCCEYMTRGEVVVLGETGVNIGAGMTGGLIYIADADGRLESRINKAYVKVDKLDEPDIERLKTLIEAHHRHTGSSLAAEMLADFNRVAGIFKKVVPK